MGAYIRMMNGWWDVVSKVLVGVTTAGVIGLFSIALDSYGDLAAMRVDLAVIKSSQTNSEVLTAQRIISIEKQIDDIRLRLRELEGRRP